MSGDKMAGWHHQCNEHEFGQTLGDGEGLGGLVCCRPWSRRVGHDWVTEQQLQGPGHQYFFKALQDIEIHNQNQESMV